MAKFVATIKDKDGSTKTIFVDGADRNAAIHSLQSQGYYLLAIDIASPANLTAEEKSKNTRRFSHNGVAMEDIGTFSKQLATMLQAGVPLLRSIRVIAEQVESRELARILEEVRKDIESGQTFSRSLAKHPRHFGQFWVSLVEVGEASGTMPQVLKKLTEYMEEAAKFRSQIIGAMMYPMILFGIASGAILVFALFVGPIFEKIFTDMDMTLPPLTVVMLASFKVLKTKFLFIVAGIVGIVFLFKHYVKTPAGRKQWESLLFHIPVVGPVIKLIIIEKFASQMAILIDSGVPILYALEISEKLVDNVVCGEVIASVRESVKEGKLLADPMERSKFFTPMTVQMIRVGEETGELGAMLNHVAAYYKSVVEEFMKRLGTLVEPFMLVFMGGIVALIVISMFMPLLTLSTGG